MTARFSSVEDLLADARSRLERVDPAGAVAARADGALLVDIRPGWQRAATGEIEGALIIERNHLEWRLHPDSDARVAQAAPGQRWVVVCSEGYTSSLAADALNSIGVPATDLAGGILAWIEAGLPVVPGGTAPDALVHGRRQDTLIGGRPQDDRPRPNDSAPNASAPNDSAPHDSAPHASAPND